MQMQTQTHLHLHIHRQKQAQTHTQKQAGKPCGDGRAGVLGARTAAQADTAHFTGVFHFFHRIIHKMVEACRLPGFFSECSQNVFRKFGGFFKKGA